MKSTLTSLPAARLFVTNDAWRLTLLENMLIDETCMQGQEIRRLLGPYIDSKANVGGLLKMALKFALRSKPCGFIKLASFNSSSCCAVSDNLSCCVNLRSLSDSWGLPPAAACRVKALFCDFAAKLPEALRYAAEPKIEVEMRPCLCPLCAPPLHASAAKAA